MSRTVRLFGSISGTQLSFPVFLEMTFTSAALKANRVHWNSQSNQQKGDNVP